MLGQEIFKRFDDLLQGLNSPKNSIHQLLAEAAVLLNFAPPPQRSILKPVMISGEVDGRRVQVREAKQQNTTGVSYTVQHPPLGLGLRIRRASRVAQLAGLGRAADLVDDAEFAKNVRIDTKAPDVLKALLTPELRARLLELIDRHPTLEVGETQVAVHLGERPHDAESIAATVHDLVDVSWAMAGSDDGHVPEPPMPERLAPESVFDDGGGPADVPLPPPPPRITPAASLPPPMTPRPPEPTISRLTDGGPDIDPTTLPPKVAAPRIVVPRVEVPDLPPPRPHQSPEEDDPVESPVHDELPAAVSPVESPVHEVAPTTAMLPSIPGDQLTQLTTIFADGPLRSRVSFDRSFAGRQVEWTGAVRSAVEFSSDVHFGRVDGVKATIAVGEISVHGFGTLMIEAVVHLPEGTELKAGQEVTFRGALLKLDGLTRDIYVANGSIL